MFNETNLNFLRLTTLDKFNISREKLLQSETEIQKR